MTERAEPDSVAGGAPILPLRRYLSSRLSCDGGVLPDQGRFQSSIERTVPPISQAFSSALSSGLSRI